MWICSLYRIHGKIILQPPVHNQYRKYFDFKVKIIICGDKLAPHINKRNKNKPPYVCTEQGGMLSALLKSEIAGLKYYKNRGRE